MELVEYFDTVNYRLKTCVNLENISQYHDSITDVFLLGKINVFLSLIRKLGIQIPYAYFQKSNYTSEYGIMFTIDEGIDFDSLSELITSDPDLTVLCYVYRNEEMIYYITQNTRITNYYYNFFWHISLNAFVQTNPIIQKSIHDIVDNIIDKNPKYKFYGLGGEAGVYYKQNKSVFSDSLCFTDSHAIYNDYFYNNDDIKMLLVDYDEIRLSDHIKGNNNILVVNISRHGLKQLASQVVKLDFHQIIYIGCSDKAITYDTNILTDEYKVNFEQKLVQLDLTSKITILEFKKINK